jgi:hypothetical protein
MKALFKGLVLTGLALCSIFTFDVTADADGNQPESTVPLRTHSIYMPYIGRSNFTVKLFVIFKT